MENKTITNHTFICAIEGCNEPAYQELWEDFEGECLALSVCSDPEHQALTRAFLRNKADMGRACLEFESRGCKHNDCGLSSEQEWDIRLTDALHKYIKSNE
jgi:hypothetical protein